MSLAHDASVFEANELGNEEESTIQQTGSLCQRDLYISQKIEESRYFEIPLGARIHWGALHTLSAETKAQVPSISIFAQIIGLECRQPYLWQSESCAFKSAFLPITKDLSIIYFDHSFDIINSTNSAPAHHKDSYTCRNTTLHFCWYRSLPKGSSGKPSKTSSMDSLTDSLA